MDDERKFIRTLCGLQGFYSDQHGFCIKVHGDWWYIYPGDHLFCKSGIPEECQDMFDGADTTEYMVLDISTIAFEGT